MISCFQRERGTPSAETVCKPHLPPPLIPIFVANCIIIPSTSFQPQAHRGCNGVGEKREEKGQADCNATFNFRRAARPRLLRPEQAKLMLQNTRTYVHVLCKRLNSRPCPRDSRICVALDVPDLKLKRTKKKRPGPTSAASNISSPHRLAWGKDRKVPRPMKVHPSSSFFVMCGADQSSDQSLPVVQPWTLFS